MKVFDVYSHPSGIRKAVKYGFSWPAFFFPLLWTCVKRIWLFALLLLSIYGIRILMYEIFSGTGSTWWRFLHINSMWWVAVGLGLWGNRLVSKKLLREGFERISTVKAWTRGGAIDTVLNAQGEGVVEVTPRFGFASPILACVLVLLMMVLTVALVAYYIPSPGMLKTLKVNDRVFVNRLAYVLGEPKRGDIVVFRVPEDIPNYDPEKPIWIKRIVGLAGETVSIEENQLRINGEVVSDPPFLMVNQYYPRNFQGEIYNPEVVPEGRVLVFGDNSANSYDGRFWGPLEKERLLGKVVFRFWPPSRFGRIYDAPISENPYSVSSETFRELP